MKLAFFSNKFLALLRDKAAANVHNYGDGQDWLDSLAGGTPYVLESNQTVDPPPQLVWTQSDAASSDAENSKLIFTWLRNLTPAVAMEERLWAYLTHCVFADYMAARWPVTGASIVSRRYLFEGKSFAALCRNGISRLWWAGYLTRDEKRQNQFELTDALFIRQDIQVSLLERRIGKGRNVRVAFLDFIRENNTWLASEAFGKRIQVLLRELNLLGGVAVLDALPEADLSAFLNRVGNAIVAGKIQD
jgi:hypothetical protein